MKTFLSAANGLCGIVPPLVWALLALAMLLHGALLQHELKSARADLSVAKNNYDQLDRAMKAQKKLAQDKYDDLKREADAKQKALDDQRKAQEAKDAKHKREMDKARSDLAAAVAAGGGRLWDPNGQAGCRSGGGGSQGEPGVGSAGGAGHAPEAGGALSAQLTELLQRLTREADALNNAYSACRADAFRSRGLPVPADNDPS